MASEDWRELVQTARQTKVKTKTASDSFNHPNFTINSASQHRRRNIEDEYHDTRDDNPTDDAKPNLLHDFLEQGDWNGIMRYIKSQKGQKDAKEVHPFKDGDMALHLVCSYPFLYRDHSRGRVTMPPNEVVLAILDAYPEAAKVLGSGGALPLHHATRHSYPAEVLTALILAYPQALDVKDEYETSPRAFEQPTLTSNALLNRPTSCWYQHMRDIEKNKIIEADLKDLERQVESLTEELEAALAEERKLETEADGLVARINGLDTERFTILTKQTENLHEQLSKELLEMKDEMENLVKTHPSLRAMEDLKQIESFNEDVTKVYENVNLEVDEMKTSLEKIMNISGRQAPRR